MQYYELNVKSILKRDIEFKNIFEIISKFISFALSTNPKFLELHQKNEYKFYVFSGFRELEKSGIYIKDKLYNFKIRSFNKELIEHLQKALRENINNPNILAIETLLKVQKEFLIKELYTITPTIVTLENGKYWTLESSVDIVLLINQLHKNIENKYKEFFKVNLELKENFINLIELKNQKPQTILMHNKKESITKPYRLFGNKFKIIPKSDEYSQRLAFFALGAGLGEKNSFGGGFCIAK